MFDYLTQEHARNVERAEMEQLLSRNPERKQQTQPTTDQPGWLIRSMSHGLTALHRKATALAQRLASNGEVVAGGHFEESHG